MITSIVLIGAGNLATCLAHSLQKTGYEIKQVYSRTEASAASLAAWISCEHTTNLNKIISNADFYIYAVNDDALESVLKIIPDHNGIHLHTAGSLDMAVFEKYRTNYGVLYPLQTFSKTKKVDFKSIPVFVEANSKENLVETKDLARKLSSNVSIIDSKQRAKLHLAAVFSCNFSNHMYSIAAELLKETNIDFKHLIPLIEETCEKLKTMKPTDAQTGPAVRYDKKIIEKHLSLLNEKPTEKEIYALLSKAIYNKHKE